MCYTDIISRCYKKDISDRNRLKNVLNKCENMKHGRNEDVKAINL